MIVDEVPAVNVIDVAVAIVIYARLAVRFGFIGPQPVAQVRMVDGGAVVEDGDGNRMFARRLAPGERACHIIEPPFIAVAVRAVVVSRIVDRSGWNERGAALRMAGEACQLGGRVGLRDSDDWRESER